MRPSSLLESKAFLSSHAENSTSAESSSLIHSLNSAFPFGSSFILPRLPKVSFTMPPSASSALVTVAEDAELRLVRLLAESGKTTRPNFVQDCEACINDGDAAQLLRTILAEQGAMAALVSLEDEAVSAVSLLAALLNRVKNTNSSQIVDELANSIIHAASTDGIDASRPISLLATLYNMRSDPLEKVGLLVKMIRLAASRQPSLLEPNASVLGKWMDSSRLSTMLDGWKVEPAARRDLYRAAAEGATAPLAKQRFTLLVVETYTSSVSITLLHTRQDSFSFGAHSCFLFANYEGRGR